MTLSRACALVLLLGLCAGSSRAQTPGDLLSTAEGLLGGAVNTVSSGLTSLISGLFGPQNTFLTRIPDEVQNLAWGSLQDLNIDTPIDKFVGALKDIKLPTDVLSAEDKLTDFIDKFCDEAECKQPKKIPSNCVGKSLVVRLAPWSCSLYQNGTVGCSPPFVELLQSPATCTAKYTKAGTFRGKECKLEKKIGQEVTKTFGGKAFAVNLNKNLLDIPQAIAASLLPGQFDLSSASLSNLLTSVGSAGGAGLATAASTALTGLSG